MASAMPSQEATYKAKYSELAKKHNVVVGKHNEYVDLVQVKLLASKRDIAKQLAEVQSLHHQLWVLQEEGYQKDAAIQQKDAVIAKKDVIIAEQTDTISRKSAALELLGSRTRRMQVCSQHDHHLASSVGMLSLMDRQDVLAFAECKHPDALLCLQELEATQEHLEATQEQLMQVIMSLDKAYSDVNSKLADEKASRMAAETAVAAERSNIIRVEEALQASRDRSNQQQVEAARREGELMAQLAASQAEAQERASSLKVLQVKMSNASKQHDDDITCLRQQIIDATEAQQAAAKKAQAAEVEADAARQKLLATQQAEDAAMRRAEDVARDAAVTRQQLQMLQVQHTMALVEQQWQAQVATDKARWGMSSSQDHQDQVSALQAANAELRRELSTCCDRLRQADGITAPGNNQNLQHQQDGHAWGQHDAAQGADAGDVLQQQGQHKADAQQQVVHQQNEAASGGGMEWDAVTGLQRDEDPDALMPTEEQQQEELRDEGRAANQDDGMAQEGGTAGREVQVVPGVQGGGWLWSAGDEQAALRAALACECAGGGDGRHVQLLYDMQQVLWAELKKAVACNIRQRQQLQHVEQLQGV